MGKKILKFLLIGSLLILFIFVGTVGLIWLIFPAEKDHLDDAVLIKNLEVNINSYNKLITMFHEDKNMSIIDDTWMNPENGISNQRWEEYKKLLTKLDLDGGVRSCGGECIEFISTSQGLLDAGSTKGYRYRPQNPMSFKSEDTVIDYKKINENWYIFYEVSH